MNVCCFSFELYVSCMEISKVIGNIANNQGET